MIRKILLKAFTREAARLAAAFGVSTAEQYKHCYPVTDESYGDQLAILREVCIE